MRTVALKIQVIGDGMLARAFRVGMRLNYDAIIFASGVSDSQCNDPVQFERERALLALNLANSRPSNPFLYFGTCSVYDPDAQTKSYVIHKQRMESLVLAHPSGLVVRLPQLVGPKAPPNTLIDSLVSKIRAGDEVCVWSHAVRNIIDVEDVVRIMDVWLAKGKPSSRILNVANPISVTVKDVVRSIESALNLVANVSFVPKGAHYEIDTEAIRSAAEEAGVDFGPNYLRNVISKYYG